MALLDNGVYFDVTGDMSLLEVRGGRFFFLLGFVMLVCFVSIV